jgi:hypothetical protein
MRTDHTRFITGFSLLARLLICFALSVEFAACATVGQRLAGPSPQARAKAIDSQLAAADWNSAKPQTPAQAKYLRSLAPLLMHYRIGKSGHLHFWMADPYNCHCIFYGDQTDYTRYMIIRHRDKWTAREARNSAAYAATKWARRVSGLPPYIGGGFGGVPPFLTFP